MSYYQTQQQQVAMVTPRPRRPVAAGIGSSGAGQQGTASAAPTTGTSSAAAAAAAAMAGRVIVDRTSFDSEDRITSNHLAPHSSDSTGGPSLASFHGGARGTTGGGGATGESAVQAGMRMAPSSGGGGGDTTNPSGGQMAVTGGSAAQPSAAAAAAPPKKLRRRKMNWKPRLPSSDNSASGKSSAPCSAHVTFQRATDDSTVDPDDMSYLGLGEDGGRAPKTTIKKKGFSAKYGTGSGGRGGGEGQASLASTNATPKLSNQAGASPGTGRLLSGFGRSRGGRNKTSTVASGDDTSTLATLETPVHGTGGRGGDITATSYRNNTVSSSTEFSPYGERLRGGHNSTNVTTTPNKLAAAGHQKKPLSPATPSARSTSSTASLEESFNNLDQSGYSTPGRGGSAGSSEKHPLPPRAPPMAIMGSTTPPRHCGISPASSQRMKALSSRLENNASLSNAAAAADTGWNRADNSTTSIGVGSGSGSDNLLRLDDADGTSQVGDGSTIMSMSPISRELAMLQAQSEGNILTPSRQQGQGRGGKATKSAPAPGTPRCRFASAAGPVDVDSAKFTDAERHLRAIHEMGAEHLIHCEYDEAVEVFTEILRGQMERHGPGHPRVGTALHNLGICQLKKGDYASAIRVCRDAVEVRKAALGGRHLDVAVSLAQLGIAHLECGQHRKALIAFREALQIRRNLLGPKHPKVARLLNNTGCALFELNEMRGAMLAFQETLDIQRSMMKSPDAAFGDEGSGGSSSSAAEQLLLSTAATLCNIGSIRLRLGDADGAIVALEEALLVQQSVLGDDHQIVLATTDSIEFIQSRRNGNRSASGALSVADDGLSIGPGCAPPPLLSRMINANVVQSIGAGGKNLFHRMEELTFEQMACGGGIDRSDAETQFSI